MESRYFFRNACSLLDLFPGNSFGCALFSGMELVDLRWPGIRTARVTDSVPMKTASPVLHAEGTL